MYPTNRMKECHDTRLVPVKISNLKVFQLAIRNTFYDYARSTKVNGLYYLTKNKTMGMLRLLWITFILIVFIFGAYLVYKLYNKFFEAPTLITIGTPQPINSIPFPAVSICHPETTIEYKIKENMHKLKLPPGIEEKDVYNSLPTLSAFIEHKWSTLNEKKLKIANEILAFNNLTVLEATMSMGMNCQDFMLKCSWENEVFPCFQENSRFNWFSTVSFLGLCCSFNYGNGSHSYVPLKSSRIGINGGLKIIGTGGSQVFDGRSGFLFSAGLILMVHHPIDYALESNDMVFLKTGSRSAITVYPRIFYCTKDVLALPEKVRRCTIPSDIGMDVYRQADCKLDCLRSEIYRTCGCHPYHIPHRSDGITKRDCQVLDAMCFDKNFFKFKRILCPYCLPACSYISYDIRSSTSELSFDRRSIDQIVDNINLTSQNFVAHITMANQNVLMLKRMSIMSFITFLSNVGGVFNLCLGISLISILEIFFFSFVRFRENIKEEKIKRMTIMKRKN